jgi:AraC family transcriptional regulator
MGDSHHHHQEALPPGQFFGQVRRAGSIAGVTLSEVEHGQARRMPEHGHAAAYYSLLLAGGYREMLGRREFCYDRSAIVYHPAGMCHWDEIGPSGGRIFIVELAPAWHERLDSLDGGRYALGQPVCLRGGPVPAIGLRLYRELLRADDCSPLVVEGLTLEMLGETARGGRRRPSPPPAWLPRVLDCLREELEVNWTLGALARQTGVEPVELSRAFRRHQGETIGQHLRRQRVAFVCERLTAEPDAALAGLAAEAGFADQSHLTRVFHRLAGTTPGDAPTFAAAALLCLLMTVSGSVVPALRAVRMDPMQVVRLE